MRILITVIFFSCSAAWAQLPGLGETRPAPPQPEKQQDKAKTDSAPQSGSRCSDLTAAAREECLREEKSVSGAENAAAGATRRPEPPTAPPPQNPR
jgi:hypothetical protein